MSSLYIIGNGFDLAHKIGSSYNDFKEFIQTKYPDISEEREYFPTSITGRHGEDIWNDDELAGYLLNQLNASCGGGDWSNFEEALGELDFYYNAPIVEIPKDKEGDIDYSKLVYINEDYSQLCSPINNLIKILFVEWIESLEVNVEKYKNINLNNNNLYFSFNYTKTLEEVYEVSKENICHIHGTSPESLIFGHRRAEREILNEYDEITGSYKVGSESAIMSSRDIFRKNIELFIEDKKDFFEKIEKNKITDINIIGHSLSEVDMPYFQEILKKVDENTKWNVYYYNKLNKDIFKNKILKIGVLKENLIVESNDAFFVKK